MKKEGVLFSVLLLIVLLSASGLAAVASNQTTDEKAYSCLETRVAGKCSTLTFEDQVSALLAMGYNAGIRDECKSALIPSRNCWPSDKCSIQSTAITMLALSQSGIEVSSAKEWLLSKAKIPDKIVWLMQIDTKSNATCKVNYRERDYTVRIADDKKLTLTTANPCLKVSGYWLSIDKSCFDETFTVSCTQDFVSSLLYKTSASNTIFVSGTLESASAQGTTQHKVESKCFGETVCDYQGTLWTAFSFLKMQMNIDAYLPYLFAFAEENEKFSPYSFLYVFTAEDEYRQKLVTSQRKEGYWDLGSGKGKFYDTAISMLAFQTVSEYQDIIDSVKSYLSGASIQPSSGCWSNSIKDTGFLLWTLWPKLTSIQTTTQQSCDTNGYFCMTEGECSSSNGNVKTNYYCPGIKVCCDKPLALTSCSEQGGVECPADQSCSENLVRSSDSVSCCLGTCGFETIPENECEDIGYTCRASCESNEENAIAYSCNVGDICCKPSAPAAGTSWIWIVLLLFLIGVVVVGIIFRHRLTLFYYQIKDKFKKGPASAGKPKPVFPFSPGYAYQRPMARPAGRPAASKEVEETLRKLKEMSK